MKKKDPNFKNGPVHIKCSTYCNTLTFSIEGEIVALFMNWQNVIPERHALIEMGHPQDPTKTKTDNSTAEGFVSKMQKEIKSRAIKGDFCWLRDKQKTKNLHSNEY